MKGHVFSALERIWEFRVQDASGRLLTGPDALKGIQQWLGKGMPPRVALFVLRAASIAAFLLLLQLFVRALRRHVPCRHPAGRCPALPTRPEEATVRAD